MTQDKNKTLLPTLKEQGANTFMRKLPLTGSLYLQTGLGFISVQHRNITQLFKGQKAGKQCSQRRD